MAGERWPSSSPRVAGAPPSRRVPDESLTRTLVQALRILYVDGVVAELREPCA